jgi:glutathione S-transferase
LRLNHSAASPYVRKVMACAIARGLDGRIERDTTNPHLSPPELLRVNPLSKVPALLLDDGTALYDSPVICEYLDSLGDAPPLFPPPGRARWTALRQQALADGIIDACVPRRREMGFPPTRGGPRSSSASGKRWRARWTRWKAEAASFGDLRRSARSRSAARWATSTSASPPSLAAGPRPAGGVVRAGVGAAAVGADRAGGLRAGAFRRLPHYLAPYRLQACCRARPGL